MSAVLADLARQRTLPEARIFHQFLEGLAEHMTPKGSHATNVIDQDRKRTYALPPPELAQLFQRLERCRQQKIPLHLSERQGLPGHPRSGLMLDFDLYLREPPRDVVLTETRMQLYNSILTQLLLGAVSFAEMDTGVELHYFYIARPRTVATERGHKAGFHILVPDLQLGRAHKQYILGRLREHPALAADLASLGLASPDGQEGAPPQQVVDEASAHVPVLFLGSCKVGSSPYELHAAYRVQFDPRVGMAMPMLSRLAGLEERYNLVYEMAVMPAALLPTPAQVYGDDRPPLVRRFEPPPCEAIRGELREERLAEAPEEDAAPDALRDLLARDLEAQYVQSLLELLEPEYHDEYPKWIKVVFVLAHCSPTYKPLARWFSRRYRRFREGTSKRCAAFDATWESALLGPAGDPLTLRSLVHWARQCAPDRYQEVVRQSNFAVLLKYVYENDGDLGHYVIAELLHRILGHRYVTDIDGVKLGAIRHHWFEFVSTENDDRRGQIWKWREEESPDELNLYISREMVILLRRVVDHMEKEQQQGDRDEQVAYYKRVRERLLTTARRLYDDRFKHSVLNQARAVFRRRGFIASLDHEPHLFGVGNGVLHLADGAARPASSLIAGFHEWPVRRHTRSAWQPFDPAEPLTRRILRALEDTLVEPDARNWILMLLATTLYRGRKEVPLLALVAGGRNGKTALLQAVAKALGRDNSAKIPIKLFSATSEDPSQPNSARMQSKDRTFLYCEESDRSEVLVGSCLKTLINAGEISCRDMHEKQQTFEITTTTVLASNHDFIIEGTDYGTWRRIRRYVPKCTFVEEPRPHSFERRADPKFVLDFAQDPAYLQALLSILVHYWDRLQNEYGGELLRVPSETIDRETQEYRIQQDHFHRFIVERCVDSPETVPPRVYTVGEVQQAYAAWARVTLNEHVARRLSGGEIVGALENSALGKYLRRRVDNNAYELRGCRILSDGETLPEDGDGGESYIGVRPAPSREEYRDVPQPEEWWNWRPGMPYRMADRDAPQTLELEHLLAEAPIEATVAAPVEAPVEAAPMSQAESDAWAFLNAAPEDQFLRDVGL